ncbi:MAG: hypothetical protein J2P50_11100 [Hyphomicrobiaceae bacterium]|nr:hypothetical protein [Hyphomicrobiaceae bacterium]
MLALCAGVGGLAAPGMAQGQPQGEAGRPFKQVKLTEKKVQAFISAQKQLAPLSSQLEAAADRPDPALQKQVEDIAKRNGFSTLEEFGDVSANISLVLGGLDPQTGQFMEPPDQIRKEIEAIKQDKQMSQQERDQALKDMQEALKTAAPLQFKENLALVKKYQKELDDLLGSQTEEQGPARK